MWFTLPFRQYIEGLKFEIKSLEKERDGIVEEIKTLRVESDRIEGSIRHLFELSKELEDLWFNDNAEAFTRKNYQKATLIYAEVCKIMARKHGR
jgi:hypothetical protein